MGKVLPKNWVETKIGIVSDIITGNTPSKSIPEYYGNDVMWVKPGDFHGQKVIKSTDEKLSFLGFKKSRKVPSGSILVTCIGNLGNISIASEDLATNQQINSIVITHEKINKKYIYYYCLTLKKWLTDNATSTTISMVNKSIFETVPIILPPLPEQERIVCKLDALFAQHELMQKALKRIPQLLKDFRQQVLTKAVTGKLTEEWRKEKDLKNWDYCNLEQFIKSSFYGPRFSKDDYSSEGYMTLRTTDMDDNGNFVLTTEIPRIKVPDSKKIELYKIEKGDLLITRTGSIGKMAMYNYDEIAIPSAYLIRFRFNKNADTKFLYYALNSPFGKKQMGLSAVAVAVSNLNAEKIKQIIVPNILLLEQQEVVSRVESLFAKADTIEKRYLKLKTKIDHLPQAILHKAFKGELSPQLPTDGDAKELLAEIKALKMR